MATNSKSSATKSAANTKNKIPAEVDPNMIIPVYNGFQGQLIYISPRTKEVFNWDSFGEMQEIELRELRNAKSSQKAFFINNWFMFDEDYEWVIDYLGVRKFYENALSLEDFDSLFNLSATKIADTISKLSDGQKKSVAYKAKQMVAEGKIDSHRVITTLEKTLGVELVEK